MFALQMKRMAKKQIQAKEVDIMMLYFYNEKELKDFGVVKKKAAEFGVSTASFIKRLLRLFLENPKDLPVHETAQESGNATFTIRFGKDKDLHPLIKKAAKDRDVSMLGYCKAVFALYAKAPYNPYSN